MDVERGQVYMAYLDPVFGRELGGYKPRPVLVVSSEKTNVRTSLVVVVPGTSTARGPFPNVVEVQPSSLNGLTASTHFQCHQIRAIEQARLMGRSLGRLAPADMTRIERGVIYCLGLPLPK